MKKYPIANQKNEIKWTSEKKKNSDRSKNLKIKAEWENPTIHQTDVQMYCMSEG